MNYTNNPVVANFPSNDHPALPADLKVTCLAGPDTLDDSPTCPVIAWNEYVYWAFSYLDNREGLCIVAYEDDGTLVKRWDKTGARYICTIASDEAKPTFTFRGQSDSAITMNWSELYLMIPPKVGSVPADVHPPLPAGLKLECSKDPDSEDPGILCPVIEWNGFTYWAYSYLDNRTATCIVAYDEKGVAAKQWDKPGARYVSAIDVDAAMQTVTFRGQADQTIAMTWTELLLQEQQPKQ